MSCRETYLSDVVADTHETPKTTVEKLDVEQGSKTTKQVEVELESQGNSPSDVIVDTHETLGLLLRNQMWSKVPRQ